MEDDSNRSKFKIFVVSNIIVVYNTVYVYIHWPVSFKERKDQPEKWYNLVKQGSIRNMTYWSLIE